MSSSSSSSSSIIPPSYESLTPQPEGGPTPAAPSNSNVWNGTEDSEELREARSQAYNQAPEILQDYIQMLLHNRREDESFLARLKEVIHGQEREEVRANQRYDDMKRASEAAKAECGRLEKEANNLFERKQMYKADFAAMRASKNELLVEKNNWEVLYNDILADRDELQGLYDGIRVELDERKFIYPFSFSALSSTLLCQHDTCLLHGSRR